MHYIEVVKYLVEVGEYNADEVILWASPWSHFEIVKFIEANRIKN